MVVLALHKVYKIKSLSPSPLPLIGQQDSYRLTHLIAPEVAGGLGRHSQEVEITTDRQNSPISRSATSAKKGSHRLVIQKR